MPSSTHSCLPRGLVLDWGGVLTGPLDDAMAAWSRRDGVALEHLVEILGAWVAGAAAGEEGAAPDTSPEAPSSTVGVLERAATDRARQDSPVHRLERGELSSEEFEHLLAAELSARGGRVAAEGLLERLLSDLEALHPEMLELLRRARAAGIRTALLSNSWGDHYPREIWSGIFDAVVISGRVGMRKPDPRIFHHTCALLGLQPTECVMVDDLVQNIRAAVDIGMVGVLHLDVPRTLEELEALFDTPLQ